LGVLIWDIIFVIDSLDWTDWFASPAIDALIWMYVEHAIAFVDAIDWAFIDARFIFYVYTWLGDYVCHGLNST
jgi:hypothetical protein